MYLASSDIAISSVLFIDSEEKPIIVVNKELTKAYMKYRKHVKMVLTLIRFVRRLKTYF